ncbi:MAG TPA: family 1 glycosylhydrolase, partial [Anaerolineales bacterium]|nr:family 1 glycosylhydrolase [Anaerolineales bacterium]
VEALREYVNLWVTINEPNVYATAGYVLGDFPPGKQDVRLALQVMTNQVKAHAAAYEAIHELQKEARVGIAHNYRPLLPRRAWSPLDRLVASIQSDVYNEFHLSAISQGVLRSPLGMQRLPQAKGTQDFVGVNYYTREYVSFKPTAPDAMFSERQFLPGAELSETGFIANAPLGLFQVLKWATKFDKPIIITENGVEDSQDTLRPRYLIQHLHQVWRAVNFNFPIKGYFYWTLVDNFEWERGWTQRFGLWALDVETQERRKRPSADLYAEICRENGISSEMVARYAPEIFDQMFPN